MTTPRTKEEEPLFLTGLQAYKLINSWAAPRPRAPEVSKTSIEWMFADEYTVIIQAWSSGNYNGHVRGGPNCDAAKAVTAEGIVLPLCRKEIDQILAALPGVFAPGGYSTYHQIACRAFRNRFKIANARILDLVVRMELTKTQFDWNGAIIDRTIHGVHVIGG